MDAQIPQSDDQPTFETDLVHRDPSGWLALFEREVRDALGVDAAEFARRFRAGGYDDFDPDALTLSVSLPMYDAIVGDGSGGGRHHEEAPFVTHVMPIVRAIGAIVAEPLEITVSPQRLMPSIRVAEVRLPQWSPLELRSGHSEARWWLQFRASFLIAPRPDGSGVEIALKADTWQLFRSAGVIPGSQPQPLEDVVVRQSRLDDGMVARLWPHLQPGSSIHDRVPPRDPVMQMALGSIDATTARNFVRMAIEDYGIEPVVADWQERIAADDARV